MIITEGDPPVSLARVQMRAAYLNCENVPEYLILSYCDRSSTMETRFVQVLVLMLSFCFIDKGKQRLFFEVPKYAFENTSTETKELCMHIPCFCFAFSYSRC